MKKITQFFLCLLLSLSFLTAQQTVERTVGTDNQMLHISANMVENTPEELFGYIDRAKAKGANTVLFSDSKLSRFGLNGTAGSLWDTRMRELVDGIREREMKLHFITIVMGFNGSMLSNDTNLTTGYPIRKQPLQVENGILKPVATAQINNGSFEEVTADNANIPVGWGFQDAIGERTFIDTEVKRSGNASFRADARDNQLSRIFTSFETQPFHQYTLSFWMKAQNLTAANVLPVVLNDDDKSIKDRLTNLRMSLPKENGGRSYFNAANNLTIDEWTEVRVAFNSQEATRVKIALAVFNGTAGSIWFDDVKIEDSPTLNWLNRDDLPISATVKETGRALSFVTDLERPVDLLLGQSGFNGSYDTQHTAPTVSLKSNTTLNEGAIVELSGWHGMPTANGQVSGSWNNEQNFANMRLIHQRLYDTFKPDGFLLNYSEIRTGGYEPNDTQYKNSGEALGRSIERAFADLFEVAPNAEYYFWSDMIDPNHNAIEKYYQINSSLEGIWNYVDPDKVTLATWWEGDKITKLGPLSLKFFEDLGFKQVVGAYYDANVIDNYNRWQNAAQGLNLVNGSLYATWTRPRNFQDIESFGDVWWENGKVLAIENEKISTNEAIAILPNPAFNVVSIDLNTNSDITLREILVYDSKGSLVYAKNDFFNTFSSPNSFGLDVSGYSKGLYYINTITSKGAKYISKLIVK